MRKLLIGFIAASALLLGVLGSAHAVTYPYQGGTGTSTTPSLGSLLIGHDQYSYCVVGVGSNGQVPIASSTAPCGIAWGNVSSSSGGSGSSTNVFGTAGVIVAQVGSNATASLDVSFAASWTALETFLKGLTVNGTTTLASSTSCSYLFTNASSQVQCGANIVNSLTSSTQIAVSAATGTGIQLTLLQSFLTKAIQNLNGASSTNQTIAGGTAISVATVASSTNSTTTVTLNINGGVTQTCPAGQAVVSSTATGIIGCSTFATSTTGLVGPSTSTYLAVFDASGHVTGYSLLTYTSSSAVLLVPSSTFTGNIAVGGASLSGNSIESLANGTRVGLRILGNASTDQSFATFVSGDNFIRFNFQPNGVMNWGSGFSSADVDLYRSTTSTLKTDTNFVVGLGLLVGQNATTTNLTITSITGTTCLQAINGVVSGTGVACGTGGSGLASTSPYTAGSILIASSSGAVANSSLSQSGGNTLINGVVPVLDGAGDYIGPNIFMGSTTTAALGSLTQNGGVLLFTGSSTLTGSQFCQGGLFIVASTTATTTITLPSMTQLASSTLTPCATSLYAGGFAQQFVQNSSTFNVTVNVSGTNEFQDYSAGTPTTLAPGQRWFVSGQFVNTSTVQGATATGTMLVANYTLYQTSTPFTISGNTVSIPAFAGTSGCASFGASGQFTTSTCSGGAGSTTTINGVTGPTFTFNVTSTTSTIPSITTSSAVVNIKLSNTVRLYTWVVAPAGGDFTTIQPALDACGTAGGGTIGVQAGTYALGGTGLLWKGSNCKLYGVNGTTTITFTGATTALKTNSAASQFSADEIHNFTITGDGNTAGVAVDASNISHSIYDDLIISSVGTAFVFHDTTDITFYNLIENIDASAIGKFGIDGSSTEPWNANIFMNNFWGCGTAGCVGEAVGNSEHNIFMGDRIEPAGSPLTGSVGIKIFDQASSTNPGNFGNTWYNPYLEGNAIAINVSSGLTCGSGECILGDAFYGGISDVNGTINVPTSTGVSFYNFNNNFQPMTVLASHVGITGSTVAPTMGTCGTSPKVDGNDNVGTITTGSGTVTACTLNFAVTWLNAPVCLVSDNSTSSINPDVNTISTTQLIIDTNVTLTSGKIYYICLGNKGQN